MNIQFQKVLLLFPLKQQQQLQQQQFQPNKEILKFDQRRQRVRQPPSITPTCHRAALCIPQYKKKAHPISQSEQSVLECWLRRAGSHEGKPNKRTVPVNNNIKMQSDIFETPRDLQQNVS